MNGITAVALAEREACNLVKIPTGRYPLYSTTREAEFDADGNAVIEFEADRDYLFTELTYSGSVPAGVSPVIDMTYCNTQYLARSSIRNWLACCDRKPTFLVGVRDNKKLVFTVRGGTPEETAKITLAGFQGNGCCG